ncbi:MAG: TonB-dependent receptor family protein [Muribaculaceae bacterium]|nr:TonB-dependent receptor family protein [Muribaculaceae bacterium]
MKKLICASLLLGITLTAAAKGNISGTIINKQSGEVIDFATVQLLDAQGKPLALGGTSDENGKFVISNVPDGKYILKVTNIGSVPQERELTVNGGDITIGDIHLADDSKMLQEVVVTGTASTMRFELDRKVFTVGSDVASAGSSASELLENIPSVEVDQDGEVSLRGNSSVTVWINGKESGLTADNRAQILEQIPAETIDRIEVITNPSAKFSPEGSAGIINIVLKKDRRGGYFGSAELGVNSRGGLNANFSINWNTGKWETYLSVGGRTRHNSSGSFSNRNYDNGLFLNSDGEGRNHGDNLFVRIGATYHLTNDDDFYLNAFGMFGHRWGHTDTHYLSNLPGQWSINNNSSRNKSDNRGAHAEFGYTHRWTDTHFIDAMVGYNHWGGPQWNGYFQHQEWADSSDPDAAPTMQDVYQEQNQNILTNSLEAKLDYTNQLTSWLKLEAGYNGNYSHENTPVVTEQGTGLDDLTLNPSLWNRFIYTNNISALYATLGGKYCSLSFSAGLRAEAWQVRAQSLAYGDTREDTPTFKSNNFSLFPSAFLSWSLPHDNELQVNYTRRIRRPWGGQLNSFRNISDPTNISYGNQELQPEYSNAFELNYIKSFTSHIISVSAYLRTSEDCMNRISYLDGNVMYTTTANAGNRTDMGVEIVGKNSLFRNVLNLTTTVNLYNNHVSDWDLIFKQDGKEFPVSGKGRNSFAWDVRCMAQVRLPWDLSFQATGSYNSSQLTAQGSRAAGWNVDAGLRKNLGNWSFSLNARNIFDSRKMHSYSYGVDSNGIAYRQEDKRWRGGRTVNFTVKYSFGNMRAQRDKRNQQMGEPSDGSGYSDME